MPDPFQVCNLDVFRSSKTKLKEQNNSVFGMAIEKHGQIAGDLRRACVFTKIHIVSSPVRSLNNLFRVVVERRFRLLFV